MSRSRDAEQRLRAGGLAQCVSLDTHLTQEQISDMSAKNFRPFPYYLPTDGQRCWIVRFTVGGMGVSATWNASLEQFTADGFTTPVPWHEIVEWRPEE